MSKKYPTLLAEHRLRALDIAEMRAETHGRDQVDPGILLTGEWGGSPVFRKLLSNVGQLAHEEYALGGIQKDPRLVMQHALVDLHCGLRWVAGGMPVYRIDSDTATALMNTSVSNVVIDDVRWPHDTFLVYFEPPFPFVVDASLPIRAMYIHRSTVHITTSELRGPYTDALSKRVHLAMCPKAFRLFSFEDVMRLTMPAAGGYTFATAWSEGGLTKVRMDWEAATNFAVSLALYLTTTRSRSQRVQCKRVEKAAAPWCLPREWVVASSRIPGKSDSGSGPAGGRGASPRSHVVRGHWRMQAHGPHLSLRKPLWIKPHWRGHFEPGVTTDHILK